MRRAAAARDAAAAHRQRDDAATTERAIALYRERFSELGWRENAVYAGVPDMLAAAAQASPRVFLCTTKPQRYAEKIVAHFGLAGFLAGVYGTSLDGSARRQGGPARAPARARKPGRRSIA